MKVNDRHSAYWINSLTSVFFLAFTLDPAIAFAEAGIVDQSVDALYNLHDQLQQVVMKSVKGVGEAMQEGPPQQQGDAPWSMDDLKKIRQRNADLVNLNTTLADQQQRLANVNAQLLSKLPPNDPRRAALSAELKQVASQMPDTRKAVQTYTNKLADDNAAIDRWNQRTDPAYVPPKKPVTTRAKPPEPVEPANTDDNAGGGGDNSGNAVDALRKREAEKEAEARALVKQREAAVNKYLDDPNADNRAEAEDLKRKLDGMVDDLNQLRGQVDGIDGVSRPPIHVRSAKAIAKARRQRLQGGMPADGSGTGGGCGRSAGGCGMSTGGGGEQHNPDGSDASGGYQDVGPGGGGKGNAASGSSVSGGGSGHHGHRKNHNAGTMSSGQYQRSTGGGGRSVTSSGQYQRSQTGTGQKKTNYTSASGHHHNAGNMNGTNYQNMSQTQYPSQQQQQRRRRRVNGQ